METTSPAALRLPPSARDFFVYERVVIELASTRQVAAEANISQTRVRQIIGKVLDWLAETLPAKATLAGEAQLLVARHIAADRLEDLFRNANKKWLATDQCKYANLALRVMAAQSKLPAVAGHYAALMATALEGPVESGPLAPRVDRVASPGSEVVCASSSTSAQLQSQATPDPFGVTPHIGVPQPTAPTPKRQSPPAAPLPPPTEDCSPPAAPPSRASQPLAPNPAATPSAPEPSADICPATRSARRAFLAPAHSPEITSDQAAVTELKITPTTLGLTMNRPLTRQERRRRRRALAAK